MSILQDAPGRFWALSSSRVLHSVATVGVAEVQVTFNEKTRAVQAYNNGTSPIYFRFDDTTVTAANGQPWPAKTSVWWYVEASTTVRLISAVAGQDVRVMEVFA